MGNNYNTWGVRNNSWGNKNRKNNGNRRNQNNQHRSVEQPNKIFTAFIARICLLAVAHTGLGWINDAIDKVNDTKDIVETVKKTASTSENIDKDTSKKTKKLKKGIPDNISIANNGVDIDISTTDVRDILARLEGAWNHGKIKKIETFNYSDVNTLETYKSNVLSKVNSTDDQIIVAILYKKQVSEDNSEWDELYEPMKQLAYDASEESLDASKHNSVGMCGTSNTPEGYITMLCTYTKKD